MTNGKFGVFGDNNVPSKRFRKCIEDTTRVCYYFSICFEVAYGNKHEYTIFLTTHLVHPLHLWGCEVTNYYHYVIVDTMVVNGFGT